MINLKKPNRKSARRQVAAVAQIIESMESRLMLTTTVTPTVGVANSHAIESTGPYGTYMAVGTGTGTGTRSFSNFGFVQTPISAFSPNYTVDTSSDPNGVVNNLQISLYNSATTGTFAPIAGNFDVYVLPDNDTSRSGPNPIDSTYLRYGVGANMVPGSTSVGINALGSSFGTQDAASLGVTSADKAGTFSITSALPTGYTTFTLTNLPASVRSIIANDFNQYVTNNATNTPLTVVILPGATTPGYADWEGSYNASVYPKLALSLGTVAANTTETYVVNTQNVDVNETAGSVKIDVLRSGFTNDATTLSYTIAPGTATAGTNYTGTSGTLSFAAGQTQGEISVPIILSNGTTGFSGTKNFTVTLSGITVNQAGDTGVLGTPNATTVNIVGKASLTNNASSNPATISTIEVNGPFPSTFAAVSGSAGHGTGAAGFAAFQVLEFTPSTTPSIYPSAGQVVNDISNLSLQLDNSAITGNFGGTPGNFNLYFLTADETAAPTSGFHFNTAVVGGLGGQGGATQLGNSLSFSNAAVAYDTYTPSTLGSSKQAIINALNAGTPIRLAVAAASAPFYADWSGSSPYAPILQLSDTIQVLQTPEAVSFSSPTYSVNKTGGSVSIQVTRNPNGDTTDTETVNYTISDGTALFGTNYSGSQSGSVTFTATGAGSTTQTITIPVTNVSNQGGDKAFRITLSNPTIAGPNASAHVGTLASPSSAVVTITETNQRETLSNYAADQSTVEDNGPYASTVLKVGGSSNAQGHESFAAIDFNDANVFGPNGPDSLTPAHTVTAINSITLQPTESPFGGTAGPLSVYLVADHTTNIDPSSPQSKNPHFFDKTGADAVEGINGQFGTQYLLGHINWNPALYGAHSLVNLQLIDYNAAGENALVSALNSGTKFRVVVAPDSATALAQWEGAFFNNGTYEGPQISIDVAEGTVSTLPAWLAAGSQATFNSTTKVLDVTGTATIIADPGSDLPVSTVETGATLNVLPTNTNEFIHLGGLTVLGTGKVDVKSVSSRSHSHHDVLVVGTVAGSAPTFSIASTAKIDLEDNDLIVHHGSLTTVSDKAFQGRNGTTGGFLDGTWDGNGLTSSAAHAQAISQGQEYTALAVVENAALPLGQFSTWQVGSQSENLALNGDDVIVKYTYVGDWTLNGQVGDDAETVFGSFFGTSAASIASQSGNNFWAYGSYNRGGLDDDAQSVFGAYFGQGNGVLGAQL